MESPTEGGKNSLADGGTCVTGGSAGSGLRLADGSTSPVYISTLRVARLCVNLSTRLAFTAPDHRGTGPQGWAWRTGRTVAARQLTCLGRIRW